MGMNTSMGLLSLSKHYGILPTTAQTTPGCPNLATHGLSHTSLHPSEPRLPWVAVPTVSPLSIPSGRPRSLPLEVCPGPLLAKPVEFKSRVQTSLPSGLRSPLLRQWL